MSGRVGRANRTRPTTADRRYSALCRLRERQRVGPGYPRTPQRRTAGSGITCCGPSQSRSWYRIPTCLDLLHRSTLSTIYMDQIPPHLNVIPPLECYRYPDGRASSMYTWANLARDMATSYPSRVGCGDLACPVLTQVDLDPSDTLRNLSADKITTSHVNARPDPPLFCSARCVAAVEPIAPLSEIHSVWVQASADGRGLLDSSVAA
jgi:hypothetical protein